jgi:hypothetical protein
MSRRMCALFACCVAPLCAEPRPRIDLNGRWEFRIDPNSVGHQEEWHSPSVSFDRSIQTPGAWQAQGIGDPGGILRHHYSGPAWYRRQVEIPASWKGKAVHLRVGGAMRRTAVYVNGRRIGEHDGFSAPFAFDVTAAVRPGAPNTFALRVVNPGARIDDAPHAQAGNEPTGMMNYIGNWGGVFGNLALEATAPTWIDEVAIAPRIGPNEAVFRVLLTSREAGVSASARLEVDVNGSVRSAAAQGRTAAVTVPIPEARLWSPDTPHLYTATVRLLDGTRELDRVEERFGMREISTKGRVLLLNGKPLYLRGYGDDNVEVLTGVPPASKEVYLERLRLARSFGFNAVRFHSMTPVREFFEAADETGMLVMAELPAAYTMYFLPHRGFLKAELERVLRAHRNHPSFLSLAFGNEFNLNWLKTDAEKKEFQAAVDEFYGFAKSIDPERLILSNDGLLLRPSDMFSLYTGAPEDAPTVRHEFGNYYCSLPDISLIDKFTGVIKPTWLEQKKSWVAQNGLSAAYPQYVRNSQRLQQLGRKYQIERVRRVPEVTGYHYWLILDYPGGTGEGDSWEEGWLDYFWRPKSIEPREGQEINSAVLLMTGAGVNDRTLWNDSRKEVDVSVSNYGEAEIENGTIAWRLHAGGEQIAGGALTGVNAGLGEVAHVGRIGIGPAGGDRARKLELALTLRTASQEFTNRWSFWSFPRPVPAAPELPVVSNVRWHGLQRLFPFIAEAGGELPPRALLVTSRLDRQAAEFLRAGGRILLLAGREQFERSGDATFFPASGGALGTMLSRHPALDSFPHDGFFDLQFFNLLEGAWNFSLDKWPQELAPIAGGIRTTSSFLSKTKNLSKTGYVFEARFGDGRLLMTTLRIREHLDEAYPEAVTLLDGLLRYASGPLFQPAVTIGPEHLEPLAAH